MDRAKINTQPAVTVLMSVYNGEKYLREAVASVLNQTFEDFEFIIIDDGSTDFSQEILRSYKDHRMKLLKNDSNIGLTKSLNKGLLISKGAFVARMDADDISLPSRLQEQVDYFRNNPQVGILGTALSVIDEKGKLLDNIQYPQTHLEIRWRMLFSNPMRHPTWMFRREIIDSGLFRYDEKYRFAQDYELQTRLIDRIIFANLSKPLLLLRDHSEKVSFLNSEKQKEAGIDFLHRLYKISYGLDIDKRKVQVIRKLRSNNPENKDELCLLGDFLVKIMNVFLSNVCSNRNERKFIRRETYSYWYLWNVNLVPTFKLKVIPVYLRQPQLINFQRLIMFFLIAFKYSLINNGIFSKIKYDNQRKGKDTRFGQLTDVEKDKTTILWTSKTCKKPVTGGERYFSKIKAGLINDMEFNLMDVSKKGIIKTIIFCLRYSYANNTWIIQNIFDKKKHLGVNLIIKLITRIKIAVCIREATSAIKRRSIKGFFVYLYLKTAGLIITNSKFVTEWLNELGIKDTRVVFNPSCTDFVFEKPPVRKNKGYIDNYILLNVSNIRDFKGQLSLIRLIEILDRDNIKLVLAGENKQESYFNRVMKEWEQSPKHDQIVFRGFLTDKELIRVYEEADVFLFPSVKDSCSIALLNAMQAELPIIAAACAGNLEIIKDGLNGLLFDPNDLTDLRKKTELVLDNAVLRSVLAKNAYCDSGKYSDWDKTIQVFKKNLKVSPA
jgi:glycosyltransferase involved in cell wall biosynthesis